MRILMRTLAPALLFASGCDAVTVTVTHAAGRMGVSVIGQLRERYKQEPHLSTGAGGLRIRAVVQSDAQADRLRLDLCGAVIRAGKLQPLIDLESELGVDLFVVADDAKEQQALAAAFSGADTAVLLSASHAEFSSDASGGVAGPLDAVAPASVADALAAKRAAASNEAYRAASQDGGGVNVRVRPIAGARAARRLGAEIAALASCVPTLGHVVLRSSMGVRALDTMGTEASDNDQCADSLASLGVTRMGGEATLAAQADAEAALRTRCGQLGVPCTVLRLGALVDGAGGVPLTFGEGDALLLSRVSAEDQGAREPPLISRNDAARLVVDVVTRGLAYDLDDKVVDAAWEARWTIASAGTDEALRAADRQDLLALAASASRPTLPLRQSPP